MDSLACAAILLTLVCVSGLIYETLCVKRSVNPKGISFPPGPKPRSIIGNFFDIPSIQPWVIYSHWGKQYGDMIHLCVLGQHTVVLNSFAVARELLDKRSRIYSDRPSSPLLNMMGWEWSLTFMRYSDRWREHRRVFHQSFHPKASLAYRPVQMRKVHELLQGLLSTPLDFMAHGRTLAGAIIMSTIYGHEVTPNDYFVSIAEQTAERVAESSFTSARLVNAFPILCRIPSWFPGAGFKRDALNSRELTTQMVNLPFNFAKDNKNSGRGGPSLVARLLESNVTHGKGEEGENVIKRVAAIAYSAGADTTVSASATFFLAMCNHPEAQKKAQQELDLVVGPDRLPTWDDRDALPYVEAIYREVLRWHPVLPLGIPHATIKDNVYENCYIPKGTTVISNIWAMTRDEEMYPDPDSFKPDRFLTLDGQLNDDDTILAFGFGRRICPGRHMADATVWLEIVSVLATFNIAKVKNDAGVDIDPLGVYTDGIISHPRPFQCSITPRSHKARSLILETVTKPSI